VNTIPTSILIAFPVMWIVGVIVAHALRRPWRKLARVYGFEGEFPSQFRSRFTFGRVGWLGYYGAITVAADVHGLYLAKPFVPWSRKLFVPRDEFRNIPSNWTTS
jgi:hypothetical protein